MVIEYWHQINSIPLGSEIELKVHGEVVLKDRLHPWYKDFLEGVCCHLKRNEWTLEITSCTPSQ